MWAGGCGGLEEAGEGLEAGCWEALLGCRSCPDRSPQLSPLAPGHPHTGTEIASF